MGFLRRVTNRLFPSRKEFVQTVRNITGFTPSNLALYEQALTHSSANLAGTSGHRIDNERLEYLGDAVLDLIVADILFKKYPLRDEGFLTELRSRVVNTQNLDIISKKIGLAKLMVLDERNRHQIQSNRNISADVLEAFIGAVYLDLGYQKAFQFISQRLIKLHVDLDHLQNTDTNFKSQLLEWSQRNNKKIRFEPLTEGDFNRKRQFAVQLLIDDQSVAVGIDLNRKQAEQRAAQKFLASLPPQA